MRTTTTGHRLILVRGCTATRPADATPDALAVAETAALAARLADELAAVAEHGESRAADLLAALGCADLLTLARVGMELGPTLRTLAGALGELHTLMDEQAHQARGVAAELAAARAEADDAIARAEGLRDELDGRTGGAS